MAQKKFIIDGGFQVNDDSVISANLEMGGSIIPAIDSDGTTGYDLGSPTAKWRDLYLSQGSLYIDGQKVIESNAGTIVVQADIDQSLLTKTRGAGVLTFQSPNPIAIAGTLQMGAGKRITSADGFAVVFGDKVDMDNNQIINIALPTAAGHAATKGYVDEAISSLINGAPGTLDTLNELANALGDDANFAATVTASLAAKAATTYVDAQDAAITTAYTSAIATEAATRSSADASLQSDVDAVAADLVTEAAARVAADSALDTALKAYADQAEADAVSTAATYTDGEISTLTTYVDQQVSQAVINANDSSSATTDALDLRLTGAEATISTLSSADITLQANIAAEASARATADAELDASLKVYADDAASDAQSGAVAQAASYTDLEISAEADLRSQGDATLQEQIDNILNNVDPAALDSLAEIVDAFQAADSDLQNTLTTIANNSAAERNAIQNEMESYTDTAEANARAYTDERETAITTAYQNYADQAESDARAYTNTREAAITVAYQSYADQAEVDAKAYTDAREVVLQANITAEATLRSGADAALQSNIDAVVADVAALTTDDVAEGASLYFTATRAQSAVASDIASAVAAEATARSDADSALQSQIDSIISNSDPAVLDSLSEIVAAFQSADSSLNGAITTLGLAAETAHSDLNDAIAAEATARTTADTNLQDSIDGVAADLVTEATARASGDTSTLVSAQSYTDSAIATLGSTVSALSADVTALTTDDVAEGSTNLYYTDARVGTYLTSNAYATQSYVTSAVAGKDNTDEITEGTTNLYFTAARAQAAVADDIATAVSTEATARSAGDTSTLSSANSYTDSKISALVGGASAAYDTLVEIQNAMATDAELSAAIAGLTNVATADAWTTSRTITLSGDASGSVTIDGSQDKTLTVTIADDSHNHIIGNVDGLQTALDGKLDVSGNAVSASKLSSAKTIALSGDVSGSVSFDGSANVTITTVIADDSHNHVISNVDGLQASLNAKLDAASAAVSAAKWTTARTLSLSGDASGSVAVDGSGDVTLVVTVADDSHNHVISNVDGLQAALDTKAAKTVVITAGAGLTGGGDLTANRTVNVGAGYGITVAADSVAVNTTTLDARYVQPSNLVHFHSSAQSVLSSEATSNASGTVAYTFTELNGAVHYAVYLNRLLLRPSEYSVSGTTVTVATGILATGDDIEVTGMKLV